MNISCPECSTVYRVDPARVPRGGVVAACRECGARLRVDTVETEPGEVHAAELATSRAGAQAGGAAAAHGAGDVGARGGTAGGGAGGGQGRGRPQTPVFGPQDPDTRAKRLARALVSDIVVYNPEKWEQSRAAGTLRKEFRDEILKSWEEYVEQVGEQMAKKTPYFRDALNAILAEGKQVF
jgi:predicted Zn finger-like uncharacterized protein